VIGGLAHAGRFFRKDAGLKIPVYLEPEIRRYLSERAKAKGIDVGDLINDLLKRDIALIEAAMAHALLANRSRGRVGYGFARFSPPNAERAGE
jgi:hypothetical protein